MSSPPSSCGSVRRGTERPIGPFARKDEENGDPLFGVICRHNRRFGQIGSPALLSERPSAGGGPINVKEQANLICMEEKSWTY